MSWRWGRSWRRRPWRRGPRGRGRVVTLELIVIVGSVVRWALVVMTPAELSLPGHIGVVILGAGGPGVLRLLRVVYGQSTVFPASVLLVGLGLGSFEVIGRLVISVFRVVGLALGLVESLRFIGMLVTFMVTVLFLVMFISLAVVALMTHTRWSSLMSVPVPVMTVRTRVLPIWPFPGHRWWRSMGVDEAEQALPEPRRAVVRRRRAKAGPGRRRREVSMWWWRRWGRPSTGRRRRRRRRMITVRWWWRWVITMVRRRRRTLAEGGRVREMRLLAVRRRREWMSAVLGVVSMTGLSKAVMRAATVLFTWTMRMRTWPVRPMGPTPVD